MWPMHSHIYGKARTGTRMVNIRYHNPTTKERGNIDPKNYRQIACPPITFKILTSIITNQLYS